MKCDINSNNVHGGLSPLKPAATDTRPKEFSISNYDEEFCKDCIKERLLYSGLHHESLKNVNIKGEEKPLHNKENQLVPWTHVQNATEIDYTSEDSGYSSLLVNHQEPNEHEDTMLLAGNISNTPNHIYSQKKNLLPVLHFEELVCSTLKKTSRRNLKSWALVLDKMASKQSMEFINLIGKKMGLDKLDILGELFHGNFRHLLATILRHLDHMDLINVAKVSSTWKKIVQDDKWAFQMYNKALKLSLNNSVKPSREVDTREYALHREAFSHVQKVATVPVSFSKKSCTIKANNQSSSSFSRHALFSEVAKTLKNSESLKVCHRCGSPARYDSHLQRATCTRESCSFDFCTRCLCTYHTAKDCTSGKSVKPLSKLGPLPCSKKSKHNLRRL